jgi:hypothetical protein
MKVARLQLHQRLEVEDCLGLQKLKVSLHNLLHRGFLIMTKNRELPCFQEDFLDLKINKTNPKKPLYLLVFSLATILSLTTKFLKIKAKLKPRRSNFNHSIN